MVFPFAFPVFLNNTLEMKRDFVPPLIFQTLDFSNQFPFL